MSLHTSKASTIAFSLYKRLCIRRDLEQGHTINWSLKLYLFLPSGARVHRVISLSGSGRPAGQEQGVGGAEAEPAAGAEGEHNLETGMAIGHCSCSLRYGVHVSEVVGLH